MLVTVATGWMGNCTPNPDRLSSATYFTPILCLAPTGNKPAPGSAAGRPKQHHQLHPAQQWQCLPQLPPPPLHPAHTDCPLPGQQHPATSRPADQEACPHCHGPAGSARWQSLYSRTGDPVGFYLFLRGNAWLSYVDLNNVCFLKQTLAQAKLMSAGCCCLICLNPILNALLPLLHVIVL